MRVPVQIISFSCFLFSLTVVRGQDFSFASYTEVTCELKSKRFGVNKINPEGKTLFRAGESVVITCAERYWIFGTKEIIRSFTCQENGEWDHEPVCEDIRCEVPRDQHVYNPEYYFRGDMTWGARRRYYCFDGYYYEEAEATCTRDGWTPKPLCAGKICAAPNIPNAEIVGHQRPNYSIYSRIKYKCHPGFEPEQPVEITCNSQTEWTGIRQCTAKQKLCPDLSVENGLIHKHSSKEEEIFYTCDTGYKPFSGNWWDSVTCSKGSWSEEPQCIREEECGAFPSVHHGKLKKTKQIFHDGETTAFECDPGFIPTQRFIKCVSGTWETPVCEVDVHCGFPPKVENALITSKPEEFYGDGSSVTYVCRSSFLMNGKSTVFCRRGTWEEVPTCKEPTCPLDTTVEDLIMERSPDIEGPVKPGHKLIFSCNRQGLKLKGQKEITCQSNEEWSRPFPKCEEVMCVANLTVNMRSDGHPGPEVSVRPGRTITLSCVGRESKLEGHSKISCLSNGEWNVPFPKCIGGKCGPPPHVNFADTIEMTKNEYNSGERVEYSCFNMFTLVQRRPYSKYVTCDQGEWRGSIKCLKPCSVSVEEMDERGIQLRWRGREKIFSPHGDRITFSCKRGKHSTGSDLIQTCNDGEMNLPLCE
ncbi:complement factor H isoform X9 [Ctenopharyngodon idella]|uniref:complement factor H isoform X9 n=1 Tax=Ctenopharyngodon idella TaxID=7959 RepID=UPI00222FA41B|nr:complement factor H isoform X9 [Ctenopharyngodon idella]